MSIFEPPELKTRFCIFIFLLSLFVRAQKPFFVAHEAFNQGDLKRSGQLLDSCNTNPDSVLYLKAYIKLKEGQLTEAQKLCKTLSAQYKDFYEVWFLKGLMASMHKSYPQAAELFTKVIMADKSHVKAYYNRALVRGLMDDNEGAVADLNECLKLDPNYAAAYYSRGYWHEANGDYTQARADYAKTIALDPSYKEAYLALAYVLSLSGEKQKACETIDLAIEKGLEVAQDLKEDFCK